MDGERLDETVDYLIAITGGSVPALLAILGITAALIRLFLSSSSGEDLMRIAATTQIIEIDKGAQ